MIKRNLRWLPLLLAAMLTLCGTAAAAANVMEINAADYPVTENGAYTAKEEVAVYLARFGGLPDNYLTKKQAQALGWDSRAGNLGQVAPGKSIGGDRFGNYEGNVPDASGRTWTECDIDAAAGYRNGKRIVFSNDGLIYYTDDHYEHFTQIRVTESGTPAVQPAQAADSMVMQDGWYTARDEVAAYLQQFGHLPANYLTREEAKALGWSSKKDNLNAVAPGYAIGGDPFGNREGLLPSAKNRQWFECDVNGTDGKRSDERLVFSNDGLIFYTPDSHRSFEQLD